MDENALGLGQQIPNGLKDFWTLKNRIIKKYLIKKRKIEKNKNKNMTNKMTLNKI